MTCVVGIGECIVTNDPSSTVITYALGSCIAVVVHDPVAKVGGILHFMLPEAAIDTKDSPNPYRFADTGIPLLFRRASELGAQKGRMIVSVAGGAHVLGDEDLFDIGKRNQLAVRKILWKSGILLRAEAVGGTTARTVRLEVGNGNVWIREGARQTAEISLVAAGTRGRI